MDEEWKKLPLFVIFLLFVGRSSGFKGGDYSDHWRGQSSDKTFSPHAIQSSVSEVPVTGILPEEVGSRISTNRSLKRLNLLQSVKGHVSSWQESTSHVQSVPSSSDLASLSLPLNEQPAGSLTLVQGSSGSSATDTASVSTPGESHYSPDSHNVLSSSPVSSQSTSDRSTPSLYSSSFQGNSGSLLETSSSIQEETAGLGSLNLSLQSPTSSQLLPSPFEVSNQSNVESTPSLFVGSASNSDPQSTGPTSPLGTQGSLSQSIYSTKTRGSASTQGSSGPALSGGSGHLIPTQLESGSYSGVSPSLSASNRYTPGSLLYRKFGAFPVVVSSQSTNPQSSPSVSKSSQSGSGTLTSSYFSPMQGSGSTYSLSLKTQGILSPYAPASPNKYVRVPTLSHPAVYSQSTSSSGAWFGASTGFASQEMNSTYTGSVQPQSITSQFAPGSPSSYPSVSLSSQGVASPSATVQSSRKPFTSTFTGSSGTQEGSSTPSLQGSTTYTGSVQPQGTASQFAPGSPSSYPSVSLSSHQGAASPSAIVQSSRKQFTSTFTGSSGTQEGSRLQGSTTHAGSLQPQGTASQFAPGPPSSYPSVLLSSHQGAASPSAIVQSSRKQFTSTFTGSSGTQEGSRLQGSTTHAGSLQPQGTASQFAPGSPSSYPSVSLSSHQGAASPSAIVQSSRKQFTSTFTGSSGTQEGSRLQGSTTHAGSLQPQGTASQFAPGSPSSYPSVSLFSHQGAASPSAIVQSSRKQFTSTFTGSSGTQEGSRLQGSTTHAGSLQPQGTASQFAPGSPSSYPSVSLSSHQGAASPSAIVQSSRKPFTSTFTGSSGTQEGSSTPSLQESTTYTGSVQPQGTASQFAPGSPSSYPSVSLSSHQGAASPSAIVQSSRKQFTSTFTGSSGTQEGSRLQGSTTHAGSLQPQGTASQFAPGSPSSYPSVSLSSHQGAASPSAIVQSSRKQFTSTFTGSSGTQEGSSTPFNLQGSASSSGLIQTQGSKSQFPLASPSSCNCPCVSLSSPQDVASQPRQALQSYPVSQSQKSPRWQSSPGIQTSGATASQGSSLTQSSPIQSGFSSLSSAGGSSSGDSGLFVSAQGGSTSYGGISLNSQSPSSKYTPWSHLYAKFGSSPLAVSTQSASDQRSNGLYSSDSLRTQGFLGVKRPSRLYQSPSDSPSSNKISRRPVTSQHPAGSNLAPSLGLNAQAPSVGVFSGILQTAQALRESGSDVLLYNQPFPNPPRAKGV